MESAVTISALIKAAKQFSMKAVALTDKYMMSGAIEFYHAAASAGIKPIIGCELCLSDSDGLFHMVLLAKNRKGYENLCRLVSISHLDKDRPFPSVDMDYLGQRSEGIIGLSGCMRGKIPFFLKKGYKNKALKTVREYIKIFKDGFYIELQRHPISKSLCTENGLSEVLAGFAADNDIPVVATNDVHYITPRNYRSYGQLFKLKTMSIKKDPLAKLLPDKENYFKSAQEMVSMFMDIPEAISNTSSICDSCEIDLGAKKIYLPGFKVPQGETEPGLLRKLCLMGLGWRLGHYPPHEYFSRLEKELSIIRDTGFSGYFLIIADIVRFTRVKNIPTCGKGSAAGSLVSYLLGISNVDPIKLNLYFERFLNSERKEPPDIDIDICSKRRIEVLKYLCSKYGKKNVSRVCSFSTLRSKAAIRETGRIMGLAKFDVDNIIKRAAFVRHFPSRRSYLHNKKRLKGTGKGDPLADSVLSSAGKIENFVRHLSMHPSAFIISCTDLTGIVPFIFSDTGEIMTQYDMNSIEKLGLIKTDLIGSVSLSLISDVLESLEKNRGISLNMSRTGCGDRKVFDIIKEGSTIGVFQLESSGIRSLARKLKPSSLEDITLLISLYRPGPQQSGMVKNFIERKFGREKTIFQHRDLEPILKDTYGVILYQEQVMRIARKIAGYSLSHADILRKAITRLSPTEMQKQKSRFIKGSLEKGYPRDVALNIFELISKFASYGFIKAHAAAYSEISYKLAYLKVYFPAELISAILSNNSGYYSRSQYIEEARRMGLLLKLPDINVSGLKFTAEDDGKSIRVPLTSIRDLGLSGAKSIISERKNKGPFKDLLDFYSRCCRSYHINKNAIENIIRAGGLDYTGSGRNNLLTAFYYLRTLRYCPDTLSHPALNPLLKLSPSNCVNNLERTLEDEIKIFGFCISASPLEYFRDELDKFKPVGSASFKSIIVSGEKLSVRDICCCGIILNRKLGKTKDGSKMLFCTIEDRDGIFQVVFFPAFYHKYVKTLSDSKILIIKGPLRYRDDDIKVVGKEVIDPVLLKKLNRSYRKQSLRRDILIESESV